MKTFSSLLVLIVFFLPDAAMAQLVWESKRVEFTAPQTQGVVTASYKYHNAGAFPVTIKAIRTNCGCTAARPDRDTVAPGEQGVIRAAFSLEGRMGDQSKRITIRTDNPASDVQLELVGTILEGMRVKPLALRWTAAQRPEWRGIEIRIPEGRMPEAQLRPPEGVPFEVRTVPGQKDRIVRIEIRPTPATPSGRSKASVVAAAPSGEETVPVLLSVE